MLHYRVGYSPTYLRFLNSEAAIKFLFSIFLFQVSRMRPGHQITEFELDLKHNFQMNNHGAVLYFILPFYPCLFIVVLFHICICFCR